MITYPFSSVLPAWAYTGQALAAALEVNKTVKQVGLSDANLNDEGRQVQLRYLWVVVPVLQSPL